MQRIEISVHSKERQHIDFVISKNMPLSKVMKAYADYYEIDRRTLEFRLRGLKIGNTDTARLLNMRSRDIIQVENVENVEEECL